MMCSPLVSGISYYLHRYTWERVPQRDDSRFTALSADWGMLAAVERSEVDDDMPEKASR